MLACLLACLPAWVHACQLVCLPASMHACVFFTHFILLFTHAII